MLITDAIAAPPPIRYTVRFPAPQTHYAEITATIPTDRNPAVELFMAVWTPGSYLVREYARNVETLAAHDERGKALAITKTRKNRWRVETGKEPTVSVTYRLYCREMSVRTNWVDERFAMLNGAATFVTLVDKTAREHQVTLELPPGWKTTMSGLPEGAGAHRYVAKDFDTLVDSPIEAGNPAVYPFDVDGRKHDLVNEGEGGLWDGPKSAADTEKIVREYRRMWGFLPYDKYVFFNLITESGGGLEHKNSTMLMTNRFATRTRRGYLSWLGLVSHEYFHLWNVKRLRPVELGPFDYENEVYTRSLWIAEGFTDYYGTLAVCRAGLSTRDEYLAGAGTPAEPPGGLAGLIEQVQKTPGRLEQPVESASYDAWIKYYRPDENSANTTVSYYTKGGVIAWLLDAKVRKATGDAKSLDDVMKLAYERYSGARGYTPEEFRKTARDVAGMNLNDWFNDVLETTKELDYSEALDWFGLRFKKPEAPKNGAPRKASLGFVTRTDNGRLIISQVPRGTPAFDAGLSADDEVLAIGDYRLRPEQWAQRMEQYHPGEKVSLLVARRERLVRVDAVLGEDPARLWQLEVRPDATAQQKKHLDAWLGGSHV